MSKEVQQLFEHAHSAERLAHTLVLSKFALYCIYSGLREASTFEEDAGMGLYHYINTSQTHWANGKLITEEDRQNYIAADALVQLRGALTLEPASLNYPPTADLFKPASDPWYNHVSSVLARTAFYGSDGQPSISLQATAPFLRHMVRYYQYEEDPPLRSGDESLPHTLAFDEVYTNYMQVGDEFLASMPEVNEEAVDAEAFWESIENFDPSTTAPLTPAGNSWAVEDMVRDVPIEIVQMPWYKVLDVQESAAYLTTLLGYMEELNERLS